MAIIALITALLIGLTCADLRTQTISTNAPGSSLASFSGGNIGVSLSRSPSGHVASSGFNNGQVGFNNGSPRKVINDSAKQPSTGTNVGFKDDAFTLSNAGTGAFPSQLSSTSSVSSSFSNSGSTVRFGGSSGALSGIHGAAIGNSAVRSQQATVSGSARDLTGFTANSNGVSSGTGGGIVSGKPFFVGSFGNQRPGSSSISADLSAIINGVSGGFSSNGLTGFPQQLSFPLRGNVGLTGSGVNSNNVVPFNQPAISHQSDVGTGVGRDSTKTFSGTGASGTVPVQLFNSNPHRVGGTASFPDRVFTTGGVQSQASAALGQSAAFNDQSLTASGHANGREGIISGPASSASKDNNASNGQSVTVPKAQIINSIGGRVNIPGITDGFN